MKLIAKTEKLGFINVNKPSGVGSSFVVNKIKRLTGLPCGHMGTLDPLASGVLPVGVGNATRLFDYFLKKQKLYRAEFTFGVSSDTLDSTGELTYGGKIPTEKEIRSVLSALEGEVEQLPPKYSAKSVGGRRGYQLARAGIEFELAPKKVTITSVKLLERVREDTYSFLIDCGAGTYIRSIARDMAQLLGTNAVMSALLREKSGLFTLQDSVPMDELNEENFERFILPTEEVLPFEKLFLNGDDKAFSGVKRHVEYEDGEYRIYRDGAFYGVGEVVCGILVLKTKLC